MVVVHSVRVGAVTLAIQRTSAGGLTRDQFTAKYTRVNGGADAASLSVGLVDVCSVLLPGVPIAEFVDQFMAVIEGVVRLQGHRFLRVSLQNGAIQFNRKYQIFPITDHRRTRIAGAIQVESRAVYYGRVLPQAEERIDYKDVIAVLVLDASLGCCLGFGVDYTPGNTEFTQLELLLGVTRADNQRGSRGTFVCKFRVTRGNVPAIIGKAQLR